LLKHEDVQSSVESVYIDERKAEEALRRSEEKFRNIFESANDCMIFLDVSGRVLDINKKTLEVYGGSREELLGKHFSRLGAVSPRDLPRLLSAFASVLAGKKATIDMCIRNKIGKEVHLECLGSITKIDEKLVGVLVVARDVTERKQVEEALRRSEEKARSLVEFQNRVIDTAVVWIDLLDAEGNVTLWNRAAELISGYSREEVVGHKKVWEWLYPDPAYRAKVFAEAKRVIEKGKRGENYRTTIRCKDGTLKTISWHSNNILDAEGKPAGLIGVGVDITETEKAQEKVRESEEKYRSLFENARDTIATFDLKGDITSVNGVVEEYGFKKEELIGKNMLKLVSKRHWPKLLSELAKISQGYPNEGEIEIVTPKGKKISEYRSNPIRQGDRTVGFQAILRDITERRQTEEALRESEDRLRQLIEYAPDAIYINDLKGNFIDGNKQAETLTGYKKEELIGKNMLSVGLLPKRYVPKAAEALMKNFFGRKTGPDEFELVRKDGSHVTVEISTFPVKREGKVEVIGIARDITERKEMEKKLKEYAEKLEEKVEERTSELRETHQRLLMSERLAAIGELATMVGHDLRNPMQSIENATYYLNSELPCIQTSQKGREMLQVINDSVNYADRIIRDLQDFATTRAPALKETDIDKLVEETLSQATVPKNIGLRTQLGSIPEIRVDKDQIKRVFLNLITNAIQAMENGGTLTASTKQANGFVEVSFRDTGVGIPKDNMEKIFTPFFTTRAKGMGMGLPICKKFVESHGGNIEVESELGKGTTFTVKLPIKQQSGGESQ